MIISFLLIKKSAYESDPNSTLASAYEGSVKPIDSWRIVGAEMEKNEKLAGINI